MVMASGNGASMVSYCGDHHGAYYGDVFVGGQAWWVFISGTITVAYYGVIGDIMRVSSYGGHHTGVIMRWSS